MTSAPACPVDYREVRDDFEYFLAHSTETTAQLAMLAPHLQRLTARTGAIRVLDFGCGAGRFTERLLRERDISRERVELSLVEPVAEQLREAQVRLAPLAVRVDAVGPDLAEARDGTFDLILANHCLYYVPDLDATTEALLQMLAPQGRLIAALLDRRNLLARVWRDAFALAEMPFPFPLAEEFEAALRRLGRVAERETIRYRITLPDRSNAPRRILRFLLGAAAARLPPEAPDKLFEPFVRDGLIEIETTYPHLVVERSDG